MSRGFNALFLIKKNHPKWDKTWKSYDQKRCFFFFYLPTAQWCPRAYIFPTAAAGVSEQSEKPGEAARKIKSGHRGLQVHEEHRHAPPFISMRMSDPNRVGCLNPVATGE